MFRLTKPQHFYWRTGEQLRKLSIAKTTPLPAKIAVNSTAPPRKLLKFPVPTLRNTVSKFVKFARPLQRDHEYHHTLAVANKFMDGGEGEKLQVLLEDQAAKMENWLTPWWIEENFLKSRNRLPTGTSTCLLFPKWSYSGPDGQIDAAAKIIHTALKFYNKIIKKELPQDKLGRVPLDMRQYNYIFGTTRIPLLGKDALKYGDKIKPRPNHITVIRNGHIFQMPVLDSDGCSRSVNQLKDELTKTIFPQSQETAQYPVGILTSENRDTWAEAYNTLIENNADQLSSIANSLFVICLDKKADVAQGSSELDTQGLQCIHGGGSHSNSISRWFDKTLQFIVGENGYCSVVFEHAPVDASPVATMMDFICDHFNLGNFEGEDAVGELDPTSIIEFSLPEKIHNSILKAKENFDQVVNDLETKVTTFDRFGKSFPQEYGISPDSLVQLAIQLAYYRVHREQPPTHQTATFRQFLNGRTGTIRLPNFYTSMFTYEMTDAEERPNNRDLSNMLQVAVQQHKNHALQVMNGQSMDRHLLGLRVIAEQNCKDLPEIFKCDAYQQMTKYALLTSQLHTKYYVPMLYGPTSPDCYVVCYNPQEGEIHFTVTSYKSSEKGCSSYRFAREIGDALIDMRSLITKAEKPVEAKI